jgi:hypothetical protein
MAKMTKTQAKRAYLAIKQKAGKLWRSESLLSTRPFGMSTQDLVAIEKICDKYLRKF